MPRRGALVRTPQGSGERDPPLRLASVLASVSQPAEIALRVTDELVAVGEITFAAACLLGRKRPAYRTTIRRSRRWRSQRDTIACSSAEGDGPREVALPLVAGEDRFGVLLVGVAADAVPRLERLLATVARPHPRRREEHAAS